jgi:hypothetical protein
MQTDNATAPFKARAATDKLKDCPPYHNSARATVSLQFALLLQLRACMPQAATVDAHSMHSMRGSMQAR